MTDLERQMHDYRLTTAQILYHMPDYPDILQSFIWQDYDLAPKYPELTQFLGFWVEKIEGKLHSVYVASRKLITPADIKFYDGAYRIN